MALARVLRWVIGITVLLAVLAGSFGVFAYATDYGVEASVTKRECSLAPPKVTVTTKALSIVHAVEVTSTQCAIIREGNFVVYHIRSERTIVYEEEGGRCIYDSSSPSACAASGFLQ